jgi:hypothetical protein
LADSGIVKVVDAVASKKLPVLALLALAIARMADARSPDSVHRTKTRRGKRDEQLRVVCHRGRDTVVPAVEASVNELPNVPGVQVRA